MPPSGTLDANHGKGEVDHSNKVVGLLLPTDEQTAEAVDPAVGPLDRPAAGFLAGFGTPVFGLLAAAADVGIVLATQHFPAEPEGVVA